ncbi:MAG: amino acid ABC transporter substrate-binding protein [Clostridiales bacterium]|nr:amino acid ABC transporter substrate-binding protein [Clostridiales bacterium]
MKKILAIILAVMMLIPSFAMAENVVKIGVFEPASGDSGAGGKQEILGMQYANKVQPTVTIGDTEYTVQLVYADNASSTDKAPSAASELVNQGVSVVLGSYGSGVSIAGSPLFAEAGIPAIGVSCTNPQVTAGNTHYFRICFLDPFQGTVLANYAYKTMGITNAYTLGELGNDYDQGLIKYFTEAFTALGGTVMGDNFPNGTADFTPYITNAQMYGAGVVFAPCSISYATLIINQAAGQNAEFALLAGDTWDSNKVLEAATGTNLNILISTFYQEGGNVEFDEGFKAWLNADAEAMTNNGGNDIIAAVSAMGYDAYFVALEALKAAGSTDSKAVNEALWTTTYEGVSGAIAFEATNGDAVRDTAYIKTVDTATGAWQFVAVQGTN